MPNVLKIRNEHSEQIRIVLEPWAHEYSVRPGSTIEIAPRAPIDTEVVEVDYYEGIIVVHAFSIDMSVLLDGKEAVPFE